MPQTPTQRQRNTKQSTWLLIIVVVLVCGALAYFGFTRTQNEINTNTSVSQPQTNVNTKSNQTNNSNRAQSSEEAIANYGFWIPALDESSAKITSQGETTTYDFGSGNAVSIMAEEAASQLTASLGNIEEETLKIDGYSATRVTGTSSKDGSTVVYLLIDVADELYFVRGTDAFRAEVEQEMQLP